MNSIKLNLGCGRDYRKGWINIDVDKQYKADKILNLNKFPYPFKDNSVEEIYMEHVLEHLENPLTVIRELWRICKPNAKLIISVPHWSHFTAHVIDHRFSYSSIGLQYFEDKENKGYGSGKEKFKIKSRLTVTRTYHKWANFLNPLINLNHYFTELILCKIIPVSQVIFTLRPVKP